MYAAMQDGISPRTAGVNYLSAPSSASSVAPSATRTTLLQDDDKRSPMSVSSSSSPTHSAKNGNVTGISSGSGVGGMNGSASSNPSSSSGIFDIVELFMKMRDDLRGIPGEKFKNIKWMNSRAPSGCAYQPTEIEHIANVITHGFWVLPAIYASLLLVWRSYSGDQVIAALVYGFALSAVFGVSTVFHCVFYCNKHRHLKDKLHRCDRAMIYVFIAGSHFPWLSLSGSVEPPTFFTVLKWSIWILSILGILYQQIFHEKYKSLETFFYILIGLGPSILIMSAGYEFSAMTQLKLGGVLYITGIAFFKADGRVPFAHAIWHLFVVLAATVHYFAILNHLYAVNLNSLNIQDGSSQILV